MTVAPALPASFTEEVFEKFLASRDEPAWLTERRREAFALYERFAAEPLDPEEFRRLELRTFHPEGFGLSAAATKATPLATRLGESTEFAGRVTHVDGHVSDSRLADELRSKGVIFGDLDNVVRDHADRLESLLMTEAVKPEDGRFAAWHAAFWTGGTALIVPSGVSIEAPLHSLIAITGGGVADLSHTLVVVEDGASATLLEETASTVAEAGLHIGAVELLVGSGADLRYVQLQNWNANSFHFAHQCGRVGRDGRLQWVVGGLGARTAHIHQDIHLDGRGAEAVVSGATFTTKRQQLSYYTEQTHNAADCRSDLLYKTVLRDRSKAVWRGMIKVEEEAQRTDGYQRCDSLMLSDNARSDSIPGLEIEADDVRCTHGATTGRVDEEQIFYAMARGVGRQEAMHMIVGGFFQQVFDRVPSEPVRDVLDHAVRAKLGIG
ncbi:MAG: Fe-S cluster assembly protein SufD [Planctomycetota bacterium]